MYQRHLSRPASLGEGSRSFRVGMSAIKAYETNDAIYLDLDISGVL